MNLLSIHEFDLWIDQTSGEEKIHPLEKNIFENLWTKNNFLKCKFMLVFKNRRWNTPAKLNNQHSELQFWFENCHNGSERPTKIVHGIHIVRLYDVTAQIMACSIESIGHFQIQVQF